MTCRMCKKSPRAQNFVHILDAKVKTSQNEGEMVSFFEAMQQLTGSEVHIFIWMVVRHFWQLHDFFWFIFDVLRLDVFI